MNGIDADIISISESHLTENKVIEIGGYTWYGFNRTELHIRAPKGSGGVGLFVKSWISMEYDIEVVDRCYDGILAIKLINRNTGYSILLLACYLSPENSTWGRNSQGFFAHILSLVYTYYDCDFMILAGDLNSRIGDLKDIMDDIDSIPPRFVLDTVKNQHGKEFIEFLIESRFCTLNGRSPNGNFTSVTNKGRSVVDYICVPQDVFKHCDNFSVIEIKTIIDQLGLQGLPGERSRIPEHAVIKVQINVNDSWPNSSEQTKLTAFIVL